MQNTRLENILKSQNTFELKDYLKENDDLSEINLAIHLDELRNSKTALDIEFTKILIKYGADINSKTDKGFPAFMVAVSFGNYDLTKVFLDSGADVNEEATSMVERWEKNEYGDLVQAKDVKGTISMPSIAFENYNSENIRLLIEEGMHIIDGELTTRPDYRDYMRLFSLVYKHTMIERAVSENDTDMVELLLKKNFTAGINASLNKCIKKGNFKILKLLVEAGADVNTNITTTNNNKKITTTPLEACADIDWTFLRHYKIFIDAAKYLLEHGADINIGSPLVRALSIKTDHVETPCIEMAQFLIDNGADTNYASNGESVLMTAIGSCDLDAVELVLKNGANVNYQGKDQKSALMCLFGYTLDEQIHEEAYGEKYPEDHKYYSELVMEMLIDYGADIHAKDSMGMTALMRYAKEGNERLVNILLARGADTTIKTELTAFSLASDENIKKSIKDTQNNNPQRLVKLLSNFTIDKPIKYTTHTWDFGELKDEYGNFDGYMDAVKDQFLSFESELQNLSENLYKKIYTFLLDPNPDSTYSWCTKTDVNIGWSSLDGLREHCDDGKNAFDYELKNSFSVDGGDISTFGEVIELFKQEIEVRIDFKNLESIFIVQQENLVDGRNALFQFDISNSKLQRQFYVDTQSFTNALTKIFAEIKKRKEFPNIELSTQEHDDRSLEIKIVQVDSESSKNAEDLLNEVNDGDFADIKNLLTNLCDWSIESACEDGSYRINYLHSNNVKSIIPMDVTPKGFTHILRFYR